MIDSSANTLFQLLRLALGNKVECNLPSDIDWQKVIDLSFDQGVAAIAVDGLQKSLELSAESLELALDSPELEDLKCEWFGATFQAEEDYSQQVEAISSLAKTYAQSGISMMLLKDYGLGLNYPIPAHRPTGDVDVFLSDWKRGDELIRCLGIKVDSGHEHHSTFQFKGQMVENHYDFINTKAHCDAPRIEAKLKELASRECKELHINL